VAKVLEILAKFVENVAKVVESTLQKIMQMSFKVYLHVQFQRPISH
jgi:hypothetical protein